jgi:quercetin dioxygenase-like cupin family protein
LHKAEVGSALGSTHVVKTEIVVWLTGGNFVLPFDGSTSERHMSSLHRTIDGDVMVRHLKRDEQMIDPTLLARHGRTARTLVKEGPLRLTLIALAAGGSIPSHRAEGPVTIHLLEGDVVFDVEESQYPLVPGEVLVLASGLRHEVRSSAGCVFLLTVVHLPSQGSPVTATP